MGQLSGPDSGIFRVANATTFPGAVPTIVLIDPQSAIPYYLTFRDPTGDPSLDISIYISGGTLHFDASPGTSFLLMDSVAIESTVPVGLKVYTVAGLPAGAVGYTAMVSDALVPVFGAAVVGGGAVKIPVYHDGTIWRVG
jgi:hypothetical protein